MSLTPKQKERLQEIVRDRKQGWEATLRKYVGTGDVDISDYRGIIPDELYIELNPQATDNVNSNIQGAQNVPEHLTADKKKLFLDRVRSGIISVDIIAKYVMQDDIKLGELKDVLSPDKYSSVVHIVESTPNPDEVSAWGELLKEMDGEPSSSLLIRIDNYINRWKDTSSASIHIAEAKVKRAEIADAIEKNDWDKVVNNKSKSGLLGHLKKYPNSVHKGEIDDLYWDVTNKESVKDLKDYIENFPQGNYVKKANEMLDALVEWNRVKHVNDVFETDAYICRYPESPFIDQARLLRDEQKEEELAKMKQEPDTYNRDRFKRLVEGGIFDKYELINACVVTENVYDTIMDLELTELPNVAEAIEKSRPECKPGYTDVFFFGVPSTGKTCVLMGLSRSGSLHINLASGGGNYAEALQQYTDAGVTLPPTPLDCVTTLESEVESDSGSLHHVNLVEMSGEEFTFKIVHQPDGVFRFEDMGTGATELLSNDNRKVFFLIIDPTVNRVRFKKEEVNGYDEETGEPKKRINTYYINQRIIVQKMVDLFALPENAKIMEKVDAIHVIVTKADTLGKINERNDRALSIFRQNYETSILSTLIKLGKQYNINFGTGFYPKLYTYSLGQFYVGGYYDYDDTDSRRLVLAIQNATHPERELTWWDKFKQKVN